MRLIRRLLIRAILLSSRCELHSVETRLGALRRRLSVVMDKDRPPDILVEMLMAGEDHRYLCHGGVDAIAVCRALWRTAVRGRREGASTIEMQLVRVLTGRYEKTLSRKVREALLAVYIGQLATKSEIAVIYLLIAYYGTGMEGFDRAMNKLRLSPDAMSLQQAASLAARLKYPEPRSPSSRRIRQVSSRTKYILSRHLRYFQKAEAAQDAPLQGFHATI